MTSLALERVSRLTGRPVADNSKVGVAIPLQGARSDAAVRVPAGLEPIIRRQAYGNWILPQLSAITPTYIESTLRGAFTGSHIQQWELFDLMEDTWPRLMKNLGEVKRAVVGMEWKLQPWAEEDTPPTDSARERARLVSSACWRMRPDPCCDENDFPDTIRDILDAWGKGTSVLEVLWEIRNTGQLGDITAPRSTLWVHPACYGRDTEGRLGLNLNHLEAMANAPRGRGYMFPSAAHPAQPGDYAEFPAEQFIIANFKAKSGSPLTSALLRPLAWWWCAANFSASWLMNLAQLFGLPIRWANFAEGATQTTVNTICTALENMGSAGWACFPEGTTLELKEPGNLGTQSPQAELLDRADKACDQLILGQTLTSDTGGMGQGSGSMALGKVHQSVRQEVIEGVANFAAAVLNQQLVPAILRQNYGDDLELPEFCPESPKEIDQKANAERDAVLITAGIEMPKEWFYKRHGIPLPQDGEETIKAPEPAAPAPSPSPSPSAANDDEDDAAPEPEPDKATQARRAEVFAAIHARFTGTLTRQEKRDLDAMSRALQRDLAPIQARVAALLKIKDDTLFKSKLAEFNADLDSLKADLSRDPATARELEKIITAAFARGLRGHTE